MSKKSKSIIGGSAAFLGLLGFSAVLMGKMYPIVLHNTISTDGVALFVAATPVYSFFLLLCYVALPKSLAKAISARAQYDDGIGVQITFKYALVSFAIIGTLLSIFLFQCSESIAEFLGMPMASPVIKAAAPSIFLLMIIAAFRGYFQGLSSHSPGIYSQLLEQAFILGIGLALATLWSKDGASKAATGAALGITIGELISLTLLVVLYFMGFDNRKLPRDEVNHMTAPVSPRLVTMFVWKEGLMSAAGQAIIPACMALDALMVCRAMIKMGFDPIIAQRAFGLYAGLAFNIVLLLVSLWDNFDKEFITEIRENWIQKQMDKLRKTISAIYKLTFIIFVPLSICLFLLARPLIATFFTQSVQGIELETATSLLKMMSFSVLALGMISSSQIVLISMKKDIVLLFSTSIAIVLKLILMLVLMRAPRLNVLGAAYSTLCMLAVLAIMNTILVLQSADLVFDWGGWVLRPAVSGVAMGGVTYVMYEKVFTRFINSAGLCALLSLVIGAIIYLGLMAIMQPPKRDKTPLVSEKYKPNF